MHNEYKNNTPFTKPLPDPLPDFTAAWGAYLSALKTALYWEQVCDAIVYQNKALIAPANGRKVKPKPKSKPENKMDLQL